MNKYILDTSAIIEYFKGNDKIVKFIDNNLTEGKLYLVGIVLTELLQGIKSKRESEQLLSNIEALEYIEVKKDDWVLAGKIANKLRQKGITIPVNDLIIAAIAVNNDFSVVTLDKHFQYIKEIKVMDLDFGG